MSNIEAINERVFRRNGRIEIAGILRNKDIKPESLVEQKD